MDRELFPEDANWFDGTYNNVPEMFASFEQLARYIKKRFPDALDSRGQNCRGTFLIEEVDIVFVDPKECPRKMIHLGFAESKITVKIPSQTALSREEQDDVRDRYHLKYAPIVKESHTRAMTLLWRLLADEAKIRLQKKGKPKRSP
jgi:hypothetical protein